ncbi:MAG: SNF2-related protein [Phycisphaerae bacterium]
MNELSLQEQLRWILTPPIQELLRDPRLALPKVPYGYQQAGIKWLMDRENALLADEMGLGKTMQAIVAARLLWREGRIKRILVVCPKSLIQNWREEIELWWPSAIDNTMVIEERAEWHLSRAPENVTIQIITYDRLARLMDWLETQVVSHDLVIIDEAQRIKNAGTSTARAVKKLNAARRWAITGTPLANHVSDVVSIFGFVRPKLLRRDDAEHVRSAIRPYMLRRRREEVLRDLPELDAQDVRLQLSDRQRQAYERAEKEGVVALNNKGDTITVQHVFALIQKLIQLCNFDADSGESAKLSQLAEDLGQIIDSGRKALVFSQFVSPPFGLKQLESLLPERCESDAPVVCLSMHGQVPDAERQSAKKRFELEPALNVMLLNYKVGGDGLNLQVANYVYLFDRWWNPAVEDQAMSRVYRIGQKHKVFVRRFCCIGTIEDRILEKIAEKRRLFAHVIDSDHPTPEAMGLSQEEVFQLFKDLKVRPARRAADGRPVRMKLSAIDDKDFEEITARIYERQGFRVERRGGAHDQGIDLIAERVDAVGTDRLRVAVQCKHYEEDVGPAPVRELLGVLVRDPSFHRADLVTSADFTTAARTAAAGHRIDFVAGTQFKELAKKLDVAVFEE